MSTRQPKVALTTEELVEDLEWLAESGVGFIEACRRLGYSVTAAEQRLRRAQRVDLLARMRAADPLPSAVVCQARLDRWATSPEGAATLTTYRRHLDHVRDMWPDTEAAQASRRAVLAEALSRRTDRSTAA
jgi:hypothetical protein